MQFSIVCPKTAARRINKLNRQRSLSRRNTNRAMCDDDCANFLTVLSPQVKEKAHYNTLKS